MFEHPMSGRDHHPQCMTTIMKSRVFTIRWVKIRDENGILGFKPDLKDYDTFWALLIQKQELLL